MPASGHIICLVTCTIVLSGRQPSSTEMQHRKYVIIIAIQDAMTFLIKHIAYAQSHVWYIAHQIAQKV